MKRTNAESLVDVFSLRNEAWDRRHVRMGNLGVAACFECKNFILKTGETNLLGQCRIGKKKDSYLLYRPIIDPADSTAPPDSGESVWVKIKKYNSVPSECPDMPLLTARLDELPEAATIEVPFFIKGHEPVQGPASGLTDGGGQNGPR